MSLGFLFLNLRDIEDDYLTYTPPNVIDRCDKLRVKPMTLLDPPPSC